MKCESCKIRQVEIEVPKNEGLEGGIWDTDESSKPYRLCFECRDRMKNLALRPLELFNLVAIHGHSQYLHDDFYDYDTGEATQPEVDVVDSERYPFPVFEEIKDNLDMLIDFSFVQYFTDEAVLEQLRKFNKYDILNIIDKKVRYNNSIDYKAYEIVPHVVGRDAESWAKEQWKSRKKEDGLHIFAELIANCFQFEEGFDLLMKEIEKSDEHTFNGNISALLYFRSEKTLDWLEAQTERIKNVSSDFGQLVASSQFSWQRCEKWLAQGRPLSLIALDALYLCTTNNYIGQSIWLQKIKPRLTDNVEPEVIANHLKQYLDTDRVPRTKNAVGSIIYNLFEAEI